MLIVVSWPSSSTAGGGTEQAMASVRSLEMEEFEELKARLRSLETARRYRKRVKVSMKLAFTGIIGFLTIE